MVAGKRPCLSAMIAVTPEHYNRMYRILKRGIPVKIEVEVRNRIGESVEKACNVIGEIPNGFEE